MNKPTTWFRVFTSSTSEMPHQYFYSLVKQINSSPMTNYVKKVYRGELKTPID